MRSRIAKTLDLALMGVLVAFMLYAGWAYAQDPSVALGTPADKPIAAPIDLALTIYTLLAGTVVALFGWLSTKLSTWLKAHTSNATMAGILLRMNDSILAGVKGAAAAAKDAIAKAKDPSSPGGTAVTSSELDGIRAAVWASLKSEYGGMDGLKTALSILGLGDESSVTNWINTRIDAAVSDASIAATPAQAAAAPSQPPK